MSQTATVPGSHVLMIMAWNETWFLMDENIKKYPQAQQRILCLEPNMLLKWIDWTAFVGDKYTTETLRRFSCELPKRSKFFCWSVCSTVCRFHLPDVVVPWNGSHESKRKKWNANENYKVFHIKPSILTLLHGCRDAELIKTWIIATNLSPTSTFCHLNRTTSL